MAGMEEQNGTPTEAPATLQLSRHGRAPGSRAHYFKPGHPGRRKATAPAGPVVVELLEDMRHVYATSPSADVTPGQRKCRAWYKRDPAGFMEILRGELAKDAKAEPSALESCVAEPAGQTQPTDEGTERAKAEINAWLARQAEKRRLEEQKFVKDGLCVCCGQRPIPGRGRAGEIVAGADYHARRARGEAHPNADA
jgi:hypothetical protein